MDATPDYREVNAANWDERVPIHLGSDFYDVAGFRKHRDSLNAFEREEVGDVDGRTLVHLQCHFGRDTLSWAKHGARVSGVDFSAAAITAARDLAAELDIDATFATADVYDAVTALDGRTFDIVYTGIGALCWLPDMTRWAQTVAALLKPGGFLYLAEFHPVCYALDSATGRSVVHDYFTTEPDVWDATGTYADWQAKTRNNTVVEFQHTLGTIVTALARAGLRIDFLHEHDFTLFHQFRQLRDNGDGTLGYDGEGRAPLMYSVKATRLPSALTLARPRSEEPALTTHMTHWGAFEAESDGEKLTSVKPWRGDAEPSPILGNIASAQHHPARISRPHVRKGWLEKGPGAPGRGEDEFVPVDWDTALDLLAAELRRVYDAHGGEAVYGGSYGWGSAGRFHHAQSQVHRFLNTLGGYVRRVNSYSFTVSEVLLPHVVSSLFEVLGGATAWDVVSRHTELIVAFGGISAKNAQVNSGGIGRHELRRPLAAARERGCRVVSVSPLHDDTPDEAGSEWLAPRPGSDAAIMLALAYVLDSEDLAETGFLDRYTVGYEKFIGYVRGEVDGVAKTPEWAAELCELPAGKIRRLARDMAAHRTLIMVSWSLQRTQYGEQPLWLGVVLAAMLGQIGLPGGGFGHGYGSTGDVGKPYAQTSAPALPQGRNAVKSFIPVARIADMLLNPGGEFEYDGGHFTYPDIRLVYWCGGNPFHHHQDLARLHEAFKRPDTVVVHDPFWTSSARHADFVIPSTMTIERDDFGAGSGDPVFMPMKALTKPHGQARDDYEVFAALAHRLGRGEAFTEGRTPNEWLRHLYDRWRVRLDRMGTPVPSFEEFWESEHVEIPVPKPQQVLYEDFRADPDAHPLRTPSGRIEIFSETIAGFGYAECPGHPVWMEPDEWMAGPRAQRFPLHLIANQPKTRLHSQLDVGDHSQSSKVKGREPLRLHPDDAAARGLSDGDLARVYNDRGSCLAGVRVSEAVRPGVVQLSTGAWYDPDPADPSFCRHGNVNVLTPDVGSSRLSQGCIGQHALVEIERFTGEVPEVTVTRAPTA